MKFFITHLASPDSARIIKPPAPPQAQIICLDYVNPAVTNQSEKKRKTAATSFSQDRRGQTGLPVSRQVVVQHSPPDVHGVGALADDDAVAWQQLGHVMEDCVVVQGHG